MDMLRTCKICQQTKEAAKGSWVTKHGKPVGYVCRACKNAKQQEDRATEEGRSYANAAAIKCQARLVTSPRTGNLIKAGSLASDKHYTQSSWHELRYWVGLETNFLTWAIVRNTNKSDMRFQRLFGVTREEYRQHLLGQLQNLKLEDYQVTWQLDHRKPLASAMSSNELMDLARITNCQVLTPEANRLKGIEDSKLIREHESGMTFLP